MFSSNQKTSLSLQHFFSITKGYCAVVQVTIHQNNPTARKLPLLTVIQAYLFVQQKDPFSTTIIQSKMYNQSRPINHSIKNV
jgi:hypothetical protein